MAGKKLSPRQKMINMMYLVLTALLALNITKEVLDSFVEIRHSLFWSTSSSITKNDELSDAIIKNVDDELGQGNEKNAYIKQLTAEIQQNTDEMMEMMNGMSGDLEMLAGINEATGELENQEEKDKNYVYWLGQDDLANGGRGSGKAIQLNDELSGYVEWANALYEKFQGKKDFFRPIAIDPAENPRIHDPEVKDRTWEYHTFHNRPVVADLAMLEKFKLDVVEIERELLHMLRDRLMGVIYKVDSLIPMAIPRSEIVTAGMNFETDIVLAMTSSQMKPEFIGNGIKINEGGHSAHLTMPASASVIPEGKNYGTQKYYAIIKVPTTNNGEYKELKIEREFVVRKPEVVVTSEAVNLLYRNCGNAINVDVPALEENYNPDFTGSSGGEIIRSNSNQKKILIVPKEPKFVLSVSSKTNGQTIKIDDLKYRVVNPPKPTIVVESNGQPWTGRLPVNKRGKVNVSMKPDREFATTMTSDARYIFGKVKLMHQVGFLPPTVVREWSNVNANQGMEISLYQGAIQQAAPGERVYIEVEDVYRVNFRGERVQEFFEPAERMRGAVIRN